MKHLGTVDQRWRDTVNGETLKPGGRYVLDTAHTVSLDAMDDGVQIDLLPGNGNWSTIGTQITYPSGWTLVAGPGLNGSKPARLVCRVASSTFTIYA